METLTGKSSSGGSGTHEEVVGEAGSDKDVWEANGFASLHGVCTQRWMSLHCERKAQPLLTSLLSSSMLPSF